MFKQLEKLTRILTKQQSSLAKIYQDGSACFVFISPNIPHCHQAVHEIRTFRSNLKQTVRQPLSYSILANSDLTNCFYK